MRRIILTFGLIAGAIMSAMLLLALPFQEQIGFDNGAYLGYTSMVLAFLMVYFGVRAYREQIAGGSVTFGEAVKVGLLITAVATVCYVVTWEVIYFQLAPEVAAQYTNYALEQLRQSGASAAEIAEQTAQFARYQQLYDQVWYNVAVTTLEPLPIGVLVTLVTAWLHSRKSPTVTAAAH